MLRTNRAGLFTALLAVAVGSIAMVDCQSASGEEGDHIWRSKFLAGIPGAASGRVDELTDDALGRALPGYQFSTLRFRQYPVALLAPDSLRHSNVIVEPPAVPARAIVDDAELGAFLRSVLAPARDEAAIKDAVTAWLRLSEELHQDGFFRFTIPADSLAAVRQDGGRVGRGKFVVAEGGKGEIAVTLTFDAAGRLTGVTTSGKILPGVRPICQTTKLLDPDPIVRRMAEQDILVMGRAVEGYLKEQRARASPELRRAIDRVWTRICDEGW